MLRALALQQNLPYLWREEMPSTVPVLKNVSAKYLRQYRVVPISIEGSVLTVASADPLNTHHRRRAAAGDRTHRQAGGELAGWHPGSDRSQLRRRRHAAAAHRGGHGGRGRTRRRRGRQPPARHGVRGAGRPAGEPPGRERHRGRGLRHPHRAVRGHAAHPVSHRRAALRPGSPAAPAAGGRDLAHQDHVGDEHRRAAAAPGRAHPRDAARPARRHPGVDHADGARRVHRHAAAAALHRVPAAGEARLPDRHAGPLRVAHQAPARHRAGHRAHRLGQDHHALRRARQDQLARREDHHGRGSGRVPAQGREPDPGEGEDRPDASPTACATSSARTPT